MNRNTSLLAALALGAVLGAGVVWWALRDPDSSAPREHDSAETMRPGALQASGANGDSGTAPRKLPASPSASGGASNAVGEQANGSEAVTPSNAATGTSAAVNVGTRHEQPPAIATSSGRM
jgi:predicted lipid-binding transport protein (Tim44 family)